MKSEVENDDIYYFNICILLHRCISTDDKMYLKLVNRRLVDYAAYICYLQSNMLKSLLFLDHYIRYFFYSSLPDILHNSKYYYVKVNSYQQRHV